MRLREGPWPQHRHLEVPEPAVMLELFAAPGLEHDRLGLLEARLSLGVVEAVALIIVDVIRGAAPQSDDQPSLADMVDQRELLGHADRMMQRHLGDREADPDSLRRYRQRGGKTHRIDISADAIEMMFGQPDHLEAQLVSEPRLAQGLVDHLTIVRGIAAFRKQEVAELHAWISRVVMRVFPTPGQHGTDRNS